MSEVRIVGVICSNCGRFLEMGQIAIEGAKVPDRTSWVAARQLKQPARCTNPTCRHTHLYEYQDLVAIPAAERP